jgi:tRNA-2-methylthio-N6-dimethylallyladenosine synthase
VKRYHVTTFGCQMNVHDSERIKGLLESLGLGEAASQDEADIVVFNTCTIREKADERFVTALMQARASKEQHPDRSIAVGGCFAESMKDQLFARYPFVDLAFGPGNISRLGEYVGAGGDLPRGHFATFDEFAGDLPARREREHAAWVQISMGCNSTCSYCIVPSVRGRERSRPLETLVAEVEALAADGVREITLLGQNVNSWGRDLPLAERAGFGGLLRRLDEIPGIARIRYTSPHPKDMRDDVIEAHRECASVCEHVHLPLQSGSTSILRAMRRTYSRERYVALAERLRAQIPGVALTTDIIVGFPGETEDDFQQTLEVVDEVSYDHAFTFIYSPRRGTDAGQMEDQVPEDVKHERLERLVARVQAHADARNKALVGSDVEALVEGPSRTDPGRVRGKTRTNKTVIFPGPAEPGTFHTVRVESATSMTLRCAAPVAVTA